MKKIIQLLILSDFFIITGFGLVNPILAVFINQNIIGGSIAAVGIATALFLLTKSLLQIVVSEKFNPRDRNKLLLTGTFLISLVPFLYAFSSDIWQIYAIQILHGIGNALAFPAFIGLFTLNVSKKAPGLEWSIYSTYTSLGGGVAALLGGWIASSLGFKMAFLLQGVFVIIGFIVLLAFAGRKK